MIGNFLPAMINHAWDAKEGYIRYREFNSLKKAGYINPWNLETHQLSGLKNIIRHAIESTDWYKNTLEKNFARSVDELSLSDLKRIPIVTKADIKENLENFLSNKFKKSDLCTAKTGGSTGTALDLYFDKRCQKLRNGAQMYADSLTGWRPGMKTAAIWGNPPIPKTIKQKLRSFLLERTIYLDTMNISDSSVSTFIAKWQAFNPKIIFGHAHSLYILAEKLIERNIQFMRPTGIIATSMMLLEHERETIEKAFFCKVTNRYGSEETGLIAVECEKHKGMHINSAHIILECVNDIGEPVKFGEPGKLVITDLNNFGMPLIRYRIEDVGVLSERKCSCGRTTPILEKLQGRTADFLKGETGNLVAGVSLVERTLTKIEGLKQIQLVQNERKRLVVNRVKGTNFNNRTDTELTNELKAALGSSIFIDIVDAESITQEKNGKYRFSICRI